MRISDWSSDVCSSDLLAGIGRYLLGIVGRRRQIDFADPIFVLPLRCFQTVDDGLDLFFADIDEGLYITAEQASPGQLTLDLSLHAGGGASLIPQVSIELLGVLPEILGDAGIALVDLRAVNNDVIGLCFLNLKRFVDQIAENLDRKSTRLNSRH